jgi:hypothetical protein
MGWPMVPVLRLQAADKAQEPKVQGKAQGKDGWKDRSCSGARPDSSQKVISPLALPWQP